ncbi:hypothetical protein ACFL96_02440 [Thermoproteota archaeon]
MQDRRRRPSVGVKIFAAIFILIGSVFSIAIIVSLFLMQFERFVPGVTPFFPQLTVNSSIFWASTIVSLLIMFCWAVSGVGILLLREWARGLLLGSMGIYFLNSFINIGINIFMVHEYAQDIPFVHLTFAIILILSLPVSAVYFFNHPSVVKQFMPHIPSRSKRRKRPFL